MEPKKFCIFYYYRGVEIRRVEIRKGSKIPCFTLYVKKNHSSLAMLPSSLINISIKSIKLGLVDVFLILCKAFNDKSTLSTKLE